ncbi:MAG: hypothetical protein NTU80_01645 [Verrucomicrobia bacterium]|nr:hypothetical protein [Verrucomicrobiota bacterium]
MPRRPQPDDFQDRRHPRFPRRPLRHQQIQRVTTSPGIVACGEFDAERYGPSFACFQQGRRKDARWTWVSIGNVGHIRHKRFEESVRAYFASMLDGKFDQAQWLDAETKQPTTEDERLLNPALSAWLPTPEVADLWLKLHHP